MSFVHENAEEFADLVQIVAAERGLRRSIVEKDYWVTHVGGARWKEVEDAHAAIDEMFWGPRASLGEATQTIRAWIITELGQHAGRRPS